MKQSKVKTSIYLDAHIRDSLAAMGKPKDRKMGYMARKILTDSVIGISLDALMLQIQGWQREQFGEDRSSEGSLNHITQEVVEALDDLNNNKPERLAIELADIFFLWCQIIDLEDVDIHAAIGAKLVENKARNWQKPDKNGVINHVK